MLFGERAQQVSFERNRFVFDPPKIAPESIQFGLSDEPGAQDHTLQADATLSAPLSAPGPHAEIDTEKGDVEDASTMPSESGIPLFGAPLGGAEGGDIGVKSSTPADEETIKLYSRNPPIMTKP